MRWVVVLFVIACGKNNEPPPPSSGSPHAQQESGPSRGNRRSEEHTSELQSRVDLVCRLLLEKKKDFRSEAVNRVLKGVHCFLVRKADWSVALDETIRRRLIEGKGGGPARDGVVQAWADCYD